MRSKMMCGALLLSVALCSQGFGGELANRLLGLNSCGCSTCGACEKVAEVDLAVKEFTVVQAKLGALLTLSTCNY